MGDQAFAALTDVIATSRAQNGRFFAYVQGSGEPIAALGDLLGSILNQSITAWRSSPAGVTIERTVVRWLSEAVGCRGFVGTLTSGGRPPTSWSWPWHARRKLQPMSTVFATHGLITSLSDNHVQQLTDRTAPTVCLSLQTAVNRPNQ